MTETKLGLVMLLVLAGIAFGLTVSEPEPLVPPDGSAARELAGLEDAFATRRDDLPLARKLAGEYLRLNKPALAIGVVRSVSLASVTDPMLTHRLAQAYEAVGRLDDALATASVARARCLRAVGSLSAAIHADPPAFSCTAGALVALEQHEHALEQMLRWGVMDPRHDTRAPLARSLAERRARVVSAQLDGR